MADFIKAEPIKLELESMEYESVTTQSTTDIEELPTVDIKDDLKYFCEIPPSSSHDSHGKESHSEFPCMSQIEQQYQCVADSSPNQPNTTLPIIVSVVGAATTVSPRKPFNPRPEWTKHIDYKAAAELMTRNVKILPKPMTNSHSPPNQKPNVTSCPTLINPNPVANYFNTGSQNINQALPTPVITPNSTANYINTQNLNQTSQVLQRPNPINSNSSTKNLNQTVPHGHIVKSQSSLCSPNLNQRPIQTLLSLEADNINTQNLTKMWPQISKTKETPPVNGNLTLKKSNQTSRSPTKRVKEWRETLGISVKDNHNDTALSLVPVVEKKKRKKNNFHKNRKQLAIQKVIHPVTPSPLIAPKKSMPEICCRPSVTQSVTCSTSMNQAPIMGSPFALQTFCQYPNLGLPVIGLPVQFIGTSNSSLSITPTPNSQPQNLIGQLGQSISVIPPIMSVPSSTAILKPSLPSQSLQKSNFIISGRLINSLTLVNSPNVDSNTQNTLKQNNNTQGTCKLISQMPQQSSKSKESLKETPQPEILLRKLLSTHKSSAAPVTVTTTSYLMRTSSTHTTAPICTFSTPPVQTTLVTSGDLRQSLEPKNVNYTYGQQQLIPVIRNVMSQSENTIWTPNRSTVNSLTPKGTGMNKSLRKTSRSHRKKKEKNRKQHKPSWSLLDLPSLLQHKKNTSKIQQKRKIMATQNYRRLSSGDNETSKVKDTSQQFFHSKLKPRQDYNKGAAQSVRQSPINPAASTSAAQSIKQYSINFAIPATVTQPVTQNSFKSADPCVASQLVTQSSFNSFMPAITAQPSTQHSDSLISTNSAISAAIAAQSNKYNLIKPAVHHKKPLVKRSTIESVSPLVKSTDCKFILPKEVLTTPTEKVHDGKKTSAVLFGPLTQNQLKDLFKAQRLRFKNSRGLIMKSNLINTNKTRIKTVEPSLKQSKDPHRSRAKNDVAELRLGSVLNIAESIHNLENSSSMPISKSNSNIHNPMDGTTLTSNTSLFMSLTETSSTPRDNDDSDDNDNRSHCSSCLSTISLSDAIKLREKIDKGKFKNEKGENDVRGSRFSDDLLTLLFEGDMNVLVDALRRCTVLLERIDYAIKMDMPDDIDKKIERCWELDYESDNDGDSGDIETDFKINDKRTDLQCADLSNTTHRKDTSSKEKSSLMSINGLSIRASNGNRGFPITGWKFDSVRKKFMEIDIAESIEAIWELRLEEDPILSRRRNAGTPNVNKSAANNLTFLKKGYEPSVSYSGCVDPKTMPPSLFNEYTKESSFTSSQELQTSFNSSSLPQQVWDSSSKISPTETTFSSMVMTCISKQEPPSPIPSPTVESDLPIDSIHYNSGLIPQAISSEDSNTNITSYQTNEKGNLCDEKHTRCKSPVSEESYHFSSEDEEDVLDDEEYEQSKELNKEERKKLLVTRRNEKIMFILYNSDKFLAQKDGLYKCNICEVYHSNGLFRLSKHLQKHLI